MSNRPFLCLPRQVARRLLQLTCPPPGGGEGICPSGVQTHRPFLYAFNSRGAAACFPLSLNNPVTVLGCPGGQASTRTRVPLGLIVHAVGPNHAPGRDQSITGATGRGRNDLECGGPHDYPYSSSTMAAISASDSTGRAGGSISAALRSRRHAARCQHGRPAWPALHSQPSTLMV